jgi:hypothetical protein
VQQRRRRQQRLQRCWLLLGQECWQHSCAMNLDCCDEKTEERGVWSNLRACTNIHTQH